jgi:hypothetical protein
MIEQPGHGKSVESQKSKVGTQKPGLHNIRHSTVDSQTHGSGPQGRIRMYATQITAPSSTQAA